VHAPARSARCSSLHPTQPRSERPQKSGTDRVNRAAEAADPLVAPLSEVVGRLSSQSTHSASDWAEFARCSPDAAGLHEVTFAFAKSPLAEFGADPVYFANPVARTTPVPDDGGPAGRGVEFPTQSDAESWIGEHWRHLADSGVESVALYEDDREVYGPMSLSPPDPDAE
jgi:hypothetical protein